MEENLSQNTQQNPTTKPMAPIENPQKNFPFKWLSLGVGLILILIILGGVYFLGKNSAIKPQIITTQLTPTPTTTSIDTSTWKTFTSSEYNFSFQYPSGWKIKEKIPSQAYEHYSVTITSTEGLAVNFETNIYGVGGRCDDDSNHDLGHNSMNFLGLKVNMFYYGDKSKDQISSVYLLTDTTGRGDPYPCPNIAFFDVETVGGIIQGKRGGLEKVVISYQDQRSVNSKQFLSSSEFVTATQILSTFKFTDSQVSKSFLEIPEYGVKFVLTDSIKDAYYLPETASKGYIYLKVHSLDSEPKCKSDPSSTAAIARLGKNDTVPFDETREEFMNRFPGSSIGDNYYYIDLAQYACADSATGRSLLEKVRKDFSEASKTIQKL